MNALLIFYSRTGTTRKVAEDVSSLLDCDVEEVADKRNTRGFLGFMLAGMDATLRRLTDISETKKDPASYDVVIIGTPNWNRNISSAIRTYITLKREGIKDAAFFCTQDGSKGTRVFAEMELLYGRKPIAALKVDKKEVDAGTHFSKIKSFVEDIRKGNKE